MHISIEPGFWPDPNGVEPIGYIIQVFTVSFSNDKDEWETTCLKSPPIPGCEFAGVVVWAPPTAPLKTGDQV